FPHIFAKPLLIAQTQTGLSICLFRREAARGVLVGLKFDVRVQLVGQICIFLAAMKKSTQSHFYNSRPGLELESVQLLVMFVYPRPGPLRVKKPLPIAASGWFQPEAACGLWRSACNTLLCGCCRSSPNKNLPSRGPPADATPGKEILAPPAGHHATS